MIEYIYILKFYAVGVRNCTFYVTFYFAYTIIYIFLMIGILCIACLCVLQVCLYIKIKKNKDSIIQDVYSDFFGQQIDFI